MATSKKTTRRRTTPKTKRSARNRSAVAAGRALADEVLAFREQQRRRRKAVTRSVAQRQGIAKRSAAESAALARARALLGPAASAGTLIAEGDSWFDYPFHDVLRLLEDEHGFDVESVAHRGDRVEDMAFSGGQLEEFTRRLEKLLRDGKVPTAVLLSGGGNDIAGDEFEMLLNHARSPIAGLNDDVVAGVIDQRINVSYVAIIAAITKVAETFLGKPLPIIVHGYDHPVPDGRGFAGGIGPLPGPWLEPGFRQKGFKDLSVNVETMADLIDRFNRMMKAMASGFAQVHYVDLRGTLKNDAAYKRFWANELHPNERGFALVADRFAETIAAL